MWDKNFRDTKFLSMYCRLLPVPMAARYKAWVCGRLPAEFAGSNPIGGTDVCCECCVLSGRDLCDGLITLTQESC
jgi:hypothetical protein